MRTDRLLTTLCIEKECGIKSRPPRLITLQHFKMFVDQGGFVANYHFGLSQVPVSLVVQAGLATSALLVPKLSGKGFHRHSQLSRAFKSNVAGTGLALATLYSAVSLSLASDRHSRSNSWVAYGSGNFNAATTASTAKSDSTVQTRPTGSVVTSSGSSGSRRSTLRSSCPSRRCPINDQRRVEPRRNGGGSDSNGNSGSGGDSTLPATEKTLEVAGMFNAIVLHFPILIRAYSGKRHSELLIRNNEAPPPPPPPPPPSSTSDPDDDNWASPKKPTSICAALVTAAVLGLLSRKLRHSKRRQMRYDRIRYCVPSSSTSVQKAGQLGKFTGAPLDTPLDCGPSGICVLQDHSVELPEIEQFAQILTVENALCPAGYTEVHFKDIKHVPPAFDGLGSEPRPMNWLKILQSVSTFQLKSLKSFVVGMGVIMGALLSLNLFSAVYHSYATRKKQVSCS